MNKDNSFLRFPVVSHGAEFLVQRQKIKRKSFLSSKQLQLF